MAAVFLGGATVGCADEFSCSDDYDCPATQVCNKTSGACEPFVCKVDDDCTDPETVCQNNACVSRTTAQN